MAPIAKIPVANPGQPTPVTTNHLQLAEHRMLRVAMPGSQLAAPEPKVPIFLSQPRVMSEFSDPDLEELSAGQKILVRAGIDNELRLKAKLRENRRAPTSEVITR